MKNKRYSPYYQDYTYTLHLQWQLYNFYNSYKRHFILLYFVKKHLRLSLCYTEIYAGVIFSKKTEG